MHLTAPAAKALAAIIYGGLYGPQELVERQPFVAATSGPNWIVKGRTSTVGFSNSKELFPGFHIYFDKTTAEARDMATTAGKFVIPEATRRLLIEAGWRPRRRSVLGLPPFPPKFSPALDLIAATNGGLVNTSATAIAYAGVLMRLSPRLALIPQRALHVEMRDDVWHVTANGTEVLSFSRRNGKVLSGDL